MTVTYDLKVLQKHKYDMNLQICSVLFSVLYLKLML